MTTPLFFSPVSQGCLVQVASHFPKIISSGYRPNTRTQGKKCFFKKSLKGYLFRDGKDFQAYRDENGIIYNNVYLELRANNVVKPNPDFCMAAVDFILSGCPYTYST